MGRISGLEDGAIKPIRAQPLVEVGGPHRLLDVQGGEHPLSGFNRRLKAASHCQVLLGIHLLIVLLDSIHPLEVLRDRRVHLVPATEGQTLFFRCLSRHVL